MNKSVLGLHNAINTIKDLGVLSCDFYTGFFYPEHRALSVSNLEEKSSCYIEIIDHLATCGCEEVYEVEVFKGRVNYEDVFDVLSKYFKEGNK